MPFATIHSVERGLRRLLLAPRDLPPSAPWTDPPISPRGASDEHVTLFREYVEYLADAMAIAEAWWDGLIALGREDGLDLQAAVAAAYERRFAGPASCAEVVWTIRTFWLRCVELNERTPYARRVPPEVLLLHWLWIDGHHEWVQVITGMPYWPIGLDGSGRWV
jgi:hypothetical protein